LESVDAEVLSPPQLDGLRVLVVDDEADSLNYIDAVLARCGAQVTPASSVAEALQKLHGSGFDVLVSDIGMPGEDGYALIRRVRALSAEQGGNIPAAALTAYARPEDRTRVLLAGFQIHITKPVEPTELAAVVGSLAGRTVSARASNQR
jgi:CheY-like chemotaxis protein